MAYKIINGHLILEPNMMPKFQNQRPQRECNGVKVGSNNKLFEPQSRLEVIGSTFFYETLSLPLLRLMLPVWMLSRFI